ncbi:MAG: hypothetical protein ABI478_02340, partial [Propionivibrio sp.]
NDDTSVSFSYTVSDGSLTAAGSASLDITPVNDAPIGTVIISGTPAQAQTLSASNDLTDADGIPDGVINYQWQANGADIAGATGGSYLLTGAEVGKVITVVASYTDGHDEHETASSLPTAAIVGTYISESPDGSSDNGDSTPPTSSNPALTPAPIESGTPPAAPAVSDVEGDRAGSDGELLDFPETTAAVKSSSIEVTVKQMSRESTSFFAQPIYVFSHGSDEDQTPPADELSLEYLWRSAFRILHTQSSRGVAEGAFEMPAIGDDANAVSWSFDLSPAQTVGISLSVGIVWWTLRAGGLLASLAASMPMWRNVDVTMILDDRHNDRRTPAAKAMKEAA